MGIYLDYWAEEHCGGAVLFVKASANIRETNTCRKRKQEKKRQCKRKRKAKCRFAQNKIPFANCAERRFMSLLFKFIWSCVGDLMMNYHLSSLSDGSWERRCRKKAWSCHWWYIIKQKWTPRGDLIGAVVGVFTLYSTH